LDLWIGEFLTWKTALDVFREGCKQLVWYHFHFHFRWGVAKLKPIEGGRNPRNVQIQRRFTDALLVEDETLAAHLLLLTRCTVDRSHRFVKRR
jgi:hypothetical protein